MQRPALHTSGGQQSDEEEHSPHVPATQAWLPQSWQLEHGPLAPLQVEPAPSTDSS